MQYRGPILLVFGLSLVLSPLAVQLAEQSRAGGPGLIETLGTRQAACEAQTIKTSTYVIGCQGRQAATDNRRYMSGSGGALFVASRN